MLSGMARRAARSGLAAGQDELGSSREEKEMEQGDASAESRVARGTTRQTSGPRKSGRGDAEGGKTQAAVEWRDGEKEEEEEKSSATSANRDRENEQDDIETVPQLDGADKEGKRDRRESDKSSAGVKRGRSNLSGSGAPPSKTMQLNSGERVATSSGEKGGTAEGEEEEEEGEGEKKDKSLKQKQEPARKLSTHRPRTRSLSNSDSPVAGFSPSKTSPMTRSHSAVKKDVEFVSLPSTKKRKKGGGRWPKRDTPSPSPQESAKAETPTKQQKSFPPAKMEPVGKQPKAEPDTNTEEGSGTQAESEETLPQPVQPPKRRRGRPPKHQRKDTAPVTPVQSQPAKGKAASGNSTAGSAGRGRGRRKSSSGDSAGDKKSMGGKSKGSGEALKEEDCSECKMESGGSDKPTKSEAESPTTEKTSVGQDTEAPLPYLEEEGTDAAAVSSGMTERKKKKKERRGSGDDRKATVSDVTGKVEKVSKKSVSSEEENVTSSGSASKQGTDLDADKTEETSAGQSEADSSSPAMKPGNSRPSVFISVLSGPGKQTSDEDPASKEEDTVAREMPPPHDISEEVAQKTPHMIPNNYSPTIPYPATTIPPFPPHAAYPYPGPYPPLMFPGSSNPMYPYYHGYPPLPPPPPPPPPPTASQPLPGSFIPSCPSEPLPPFSATQPLTTVCGVQVSILDKPPTQLPTTLSPHSLPISTQHQAPLPHTVGEGSPKAYNLSPSAMEMPRHYPPPHPLTQTYRPGMLPGPAGAHYMPHSPYVSVRIDPTGMPFVDWGMPHSHLPPHHPKAEDMNKFLPGKLEPKQEEVPVQSVECPECGRSFKNNKALNGHMRLHGGFDWTKKPFNASQHQSSSSTAEQSSKTHPPNEDKPHTKKSVSKKRNHSRSRSHSPAPDNSKRRRCSNGSNGSDKDGEKRSGEPSVFTFDTSQMHPSQHVMPPSPLNTMQDAGTMTGQARGTVAGTKSAPRNATLDDLCRAVEALEKMENGNSCGVNPSMRESDDDDKRRPGNIHIPTHTSPSLERDRHRFESTPPYTPPPILSPARSMAMLAAPGTPSRILQPWSCRRSSDHRKQSEADEGYLEPKINVGKQFQAVLPPFDDTHGTASEDTHLAEQVWKPISQPLEEDESIIDGFLELACSPAIQYAGRNKEYALHVLHNTGGSVKEAVRLLLSGKSVFPEDHPMSTYHYSGTKLWSARERQQFRRAWRVHRKQFYLLKSAVEGKTLPEVTEYYYYWKKYCSDEYRGRNRHISEEIMSDEDLACPPSHSSDSTSSSEMDAAAPATSSHRPPELEKMDKPLRKSRAETNIAFRPPMAAPFDLPIVYAPHSSRVPLGVPVQQYKCKYPGCTQVFTSIFALNGHIRIHGGSFYPKSDKKDVRSCSPSTTSSSSTPPNTLHPSHPHHSTIPTIRAGSNGPVKHSRPAPSVAAEMRSAQHLEIARALLDLPQPRSPARNAYHTPSPKPSPGSKRSPSGKKKMSSSSPGEHEGYYPCNRCGRVFTKVKSRSAHMKSHIMKPS